MIYIKRTLWLLFHPIIWLLVGVLFMVSLALIGFVCMFLYIKNGDIEGCSDFLGWCVKLVEWYNNIEPKED